MPRYYEKAVYHELGVAIASALKKSHCEFIVNYENVNFTFLDCPHALLKKNNKSEKVKGRRFNTQRIQSQLKWFKPARGIVISPGKTIIWPNDCT